MTAPGKASEPDVEMVEVSPAANYQLAHDGTVVGPGETITVPADVADRWVKCGWATV